MTIAVLGAGEMGVALAKRIAAAGEDVLLAARDLKKTAAIARKLRARVKAVDASAVSAADIIILAVPAQTAARVVKEAGGLAGKIVIDATNPVGPNLSLATFAGKSAAEEIQKRAPKAKVVKGFNTIFANLLEHRPRRNRPQVFLASDDEAAKKTATAFVKKIGLDPIDAGPLENARQIEAIGNLIVRFAYGYGRGTNFVPLFYSY